MNIFKIHNKYSYYRGEDTVVNEEAELLKSKNHKVTQLFRNNSTELTRVYDKIIALYNLSYSNKTIKILKDKISKAGKPDIVHVHNTFPLWTYSTFDYLNTINVPVVFTLHNFRIILDRISLFDKEIYKYSLIKNSKLLNFFISKLINKNKYLLNYVDKFITHTEFTKKKFINYGIPKDKIIIKPNFVKKSKNRILSIKNKSNAIYASRISKEKGITTLLKTWHHLNLKIDIFGEGPLLKDLNIENKNINFRGNLPKDKIGKLINNSKFLIYPSECFETFGMTIVEAFNEGTLVLASNIGSIKSIIKNYYNGILFESGNSHDLLKKIKWIINNPNKCDQIALNAKKYFDEKYSSNQNYNQKIKIYNEAISNKKKN